MLDQQEFARFRQCLEEHGVTLPSRDPQNGQGEPPAISEEAREAFEACSQYLPARPQDGFGG